jgi:predicted nucleotidyltransferase
MAPKKIDSSRFSQDILDFIICLHKHNVKCVIIGGQAVIFYGHARLTGDIDFFYEKSEQNAKKLFSALEEFWEGEIPEIRDAKELLQEDLILQFGVPPNRIDLINELGNIDFQSVWESKVTVQIKISSDWIFVHFIGLELLIKNKHEANRPRDQEDLKFLKSLLNE